MGGLTAYDPVNSAPPEDGTCRNGCPAASNTARTTSGSNASLVPLAISAAAASVENGQARLEFWVNGLQAGMTDEVMERTIRCG